MCDLDYSLAFIEFRRFGLINHPMRSQRALRGEIVLRILLVECRELESAQTQQRLELCGFQVFPASNAAFGLQLYEHVKPDVVIIGKGCSLLIRQLKESCPSVPIVTLGEESDEFQLAENRGNGIELLDPAEWVELMIAS